MNRKLWIQVASFIGVKVVFNSALRMVYPFLPAFGRGLGVGLETLSGAMALRAGIGVLGPFLASTADTRGRKFGMLLGLGLFIAANGLILVKPTLLVFTIVLILTLLAYFAFNPSMQAYLGDHIPYRQRGQALALTELGWSLSFLIGIPLVGLIMARAGWRAPFPVLIFFGLVSLGGIYWLIPRDGQRPVNQPGLVKMIGLVIRSKPALAGMVLGCAASLANELIALTFGVWLEDSFGFKVTALGAAAMIIGISELTGELLSVGFVDRLGKSRSVALGLAANCLAALALAWLGQSMIGGLAGLFLFFLSFEFTIVGCIPLMTEILPEARATLMACFFAVISLGRAMGDLLAPWLFRIPLLPIKYSGLETIAIGIVFFNLIALLALRFVGRRQGSIIEITV